MNLKSRVIEYTKSIGVDLIGFTTAEPFEDIREVLQLRQQQGHFSGFEEKNIELRVDPKKTLEDAESIIVIAMSYYSDEEVLPTENPKFHGELARTAWGIDYHTILQDKLQQIASFIEKEKEDFNYKIFVDTGPLVDRQVAYRAGLGWYGYNSLLINKEYGSWIFIGYMLNNLKFQSDAPITGCQCLGCNLCIKHCPKGAIEAPYQFNANKCMSNILQKKEDVSEEDRSILGKNLYGCDICQKVCPHNKEIKVSQCSDFKPQNPPHKPDLIELLHISNKGFKESYGTTSAGWRGKKVLQRNALIALVNHKDKEAVPLILPLLKDPRKEIRKYTIWAIYKLDSEIAYKEFNKLKDEEQDTEVLEMLHHYLRSLS
ncbi:MAG: tRNA epoxyqueuosine(34) reductase QueG [Clostridiaceae bacterium]|nr:tRNA epoxyqueuosine(34) reductase QueG [Clostridiaceae bacterium]